MRLYKRSDGGNWWVSSATAGDKLERALERPTARQHRSTAIGLKQISGGKRV